MANRDTLIARKEEVRRKLEQMRRTLERERAKDPPSQRQINRLETQLEQLMAEEYNLRVAIDRARYTHK